MRKIALFFYARVVVGADHNGRKPEHDDAEHHKADGGDGGQRRDKVRDGVDGQRHGGNVRHFALLPPCQPHQHERRAPEQPQVCRAQRRGQPCPHPAGLAAAEDQLQHKPRRAEHGRQPGFGGQQQIAHKGQHGERYLLYGGIFRHSQQGAPRRRHTDKQVSQSGFIAFVHSDNTPDRNAPVGAGHARPAAFPQASARHTAAGRIYAAPTVFQFNFYYTSFITPLQALARRRIMRMFIQENVRF